MATALSWSDMKTPLRLTFAALLLTLVSACAPIQTKTETPHSVLLVSIDGFRPDYLGQGMTPNLDRIAAQGVRAEWMNPSFPSLTFPNHYTIVTGLRPDRHGIVHNNMRDPELGRFSLSNRDAVGNAKWWGGEPIWIAVQKAGYPTAAMFWPGSEAPIMGTHPTRWSVYDAKVTYQQRVNNVVGWLKEPLTTRPRFVTLYFDDVDHQGHSFGPFSKQAREAVANVDRSIGNLFEQLQRDGSLDYTNVIIVSDHGMATVLPSNKVNVADMVPVEWVNVVAAGQTVGFTPKPGFEQQAAAKLIGKHERYECWDKTKVPARFHYGTNPRVPQIICLMQDGWDALNPDTFAKAKNSTQARGSHGFDPSSPDMRALFIATGPDIAQRKVVRPFDNVDVYPLMIELLRVPGAKVDGDLEPVRGVLRQ